MPAADKKNELSLSRPLPGGQAMRRSELVLGDGYRTGIYFHPPSGGSSDREPVLYVHGIQSHPGWFTGSAAYLAERGHLVFQVTRRGSGLNVRDRGHAASAKQLLDDVRIACRYVLDQASARRLHLLGVSWGGKLLTCYALGRENRDHIASLTLVAPGIVPRVDVGFGTKLAIALSLAASGRKKFQIPLSDVDLFTDNERMREYLRADRARLQRATGRLLYVSRCLDRIIKKAPRGSLAVPTTLILSKRDRIIDNDRTLAAIRRLAGRQLTDRHFDAAHTLEFQPDPARF